jgi:ribonuclease-3
MNFAALEARLGHRFSSPGHLERALTHRSRAHERLTGGAEEEIRAADNETFEFVGDSVLGLVVAEQLFRMHPTLGEGDLTLMKHRLVSMETLAAVAGSLKLGEFIQIGRGEEGTGGRAKPALLANTLEAVIAAIFLDAGYVAARSFVVRVFAEEFRRTTPLGSLDFKSRLQEKLQADKLSAPSYRLLKSEGPPHDRTFFVEAIWEGGRAEGSGRSIKAAEMVAAEAALGMLGQGAAETAS